LDFTKIPNITDIQLEASNIINFFKCPYVICVFFAQILYQYCECTFKCYEVSDELWHIVNHFGNLGVLCVWDAALFNDFQELLWGWLRVSEGIS